MKLQNIKLNGILSNNYLWAGALSLAWHQLKEEIIQEDICLDTKDENVLKIVENFNHCPFKKSHLSRDCYYIKAGYGNKTINLINQ